MSVQYIGSDSGLQSFKNLFTKYFRVTASDVDIEAAIYEINSMETLFKVPKKFAVPTYFYITTQSKDVISKVREYPINGLIFPPINVDSVVSKLKFAGGSPSKRSEDYEMIKIKVLAKAESIPPLPSLAVELINLTKSDSSTISEVTKKIKQDQGISSRVVKLVNSPFYGVRQEISSIDRAIMLLGFNSIKNIALAISIDSYFQKPFNMFKTTGKAMWAHSYKVACISQEIAKYLNNLNDDALYMSGLLHDIGKIVMADFLVKEVSSIEEERDQLGFDHAEIGAVILSKWSVSTSVVEGVKNHHNFNSPMFGKIVYYANRIDNEFEHAAEIISEMGLIFDIKDVDRFKEKIINFVKDFNEKH